MAIRDLLRNQYTFQSLSPAARTNGTGTGTAADLRGYDAAVITVSFGTWTDGTHTPSAVQSVDGTTYTVVRLRPTACSKSAISVRSVLCRLS
jgi:hypothetical protein